MKVTKLILCLIVLSVIVTVPMMAKGPSGRAGRSNIALLNLYEKSGPDTEPPWQIVEDGLWGKMKYNCSGPTLNFVFNGHGFPADEEDHSFTLIYYPDPWPGKGLICLGSGVVEEDLVWDEDLEELVGNGEYNVHIEGSVDPEGDLPIEGDVNEGAKIWLVPSEIVDCDGQEMVGWDSLTRIMFEEDLITFDDTDD